ncbi:MAG: hypothetical protein FWC94_01465 [Bacteroidales bacterium]|nr:hypothetical protein [Bacteroidales bacterium]
MTKKTLPLILVLALSFSVFAQQNNMMFVHQGQNGIEHAITDVDNTVFIDTMLYQPTGTVVDGQWLTSLGVVSFATDSTWTIRGRDELTQIWSDAVTASGCQKTTFKGGTEEEGVWTFHVDCRSNPGFKGDLFSWQAVYELRDQLCPYPWRVPTMQDFIDLDIAMGGTGRNRGDRPEFVIDNYINRWGGAFGGGSGPTGTLWHQNSWGDYWSQSTTDCGYGIYLFFSKLGSVGPRDWDSRADGLKLRCVK